MTTFDEITTSKKANDDSRRGRAIASLSRYREMHPFFGKHHKYCRLARLGFLKNRKNGRENLYLEGGE